MAGKRQTAILGHFTFGFNFRNKALYLFLPKRNEEHNRRNIPCGKKRKSIIETQ